MITRKRLIKYALTPVLAGLALAAVTAVALRPSDSTTGEASSHREAPLISADPLADATDTYAFISNDAPDKLTLVGNWIPLEEPAGGPNFYNFGDDVTYDFDIDNNGNSYSDVVYRFKFHTEVQDPTTFLYATGPITSLDDPNFNIRQFYDVYRKEAPGDFKLIASHLQTPPNNIGPTSTPNYDSVASQAIYTLPNGGKVFAGQRDDPFFVDLGSIFDLASLRNLPGNAGGGIDGVGGFNTNSIVLQVPITDVTRCHCDAAAAASQTPQASTTAATTRTATAKTATAARTPEASTSSVQTSNRNKPQDPPNLIVGVWTETYRQRVNVFHQDGSQSDEGPLREVSRLGNPLVNEVVIPLSSKDKFNASKPNDDAQFLGFVLNSDLASKLNAVYGLGLPATARTDLATVFLTGIPGLNQPPGVVGSEQLRINLGIKPGDPGCAAPSRFGVIGGDVCGFPNGRRLADDVTDIELRAVACGYGFDLGPCSNSAPYAATTTKLGDGVDGNDKQFLSSFPYVASPHSGFDHEHHTGVVVPPLFAGMGGAGATLALVVAGSLAFGFVRRRRAADAVTGTDD